MKLLITAFLAFASFVANAGFAPITVQEFYAQGNTNMWQPSRELACQQRSDTIGVASTIVDAFYNGGSMCRIRITADGDLLNYAYTIRELYNQCPANSTNVNGSCECNSGYSASGSSCIPVVRSCPDSDGSLAATNITTGWATGPLANVADVVINYGIPDHVQDSVCRGAVVDSGRCFRSQVPASNGLYRISCDVLYIVTGDPQPGGPLAVADPTAPPPACPGFQGEVNGVPVCVGTPSSPLTTTSPAGDSPELPGNPPAGYRDDSGPRTPVDGSGGQEGGPASAGAPSYGSGSSGDDPNTPQIEFPDACGAPGQPVCSVKVDEGNLSSSVGERFSDSATGISALDSVMGAAIDQAKGVTAPGWTWTMQLPSACSPIPLPAFEMEVDVCQFQPVIHDLMSLVWVAAGFFGLFGLLGRTFNGGA